MKRLLNGWNVFRWLRLLLGGGAAVQGITERGNFLLVAGIIIVASAVFDVGCCGSAGCAVSASGKESVKEIEYEEVDETK